MRIGAGDKCKKWRKNNGEYNGDPDQVRWNIKDESELDAYVGKEAGDGNHKD